MQIMPLTMPLLPVMPNVGTEAGAKLGRLRSANQGVITLSGEDQGGDDRSSRTKRLRVVSTFEYELR